MDSDPGCDIICDPKSHTADIFCQTVWILLKDTIYRLSVFLVYLRSQIQRDPIFLQKDHGTAHIRLFCHLFRNLHGFLFADTFDLCQPFRFFFHDPHSIIPKPPDDSCRQRGTDTFDRTGTQITLHRKCIFRHFFHIGGYLKLFSVYRMCCIISGSFN